MEGSKRGYGQESPREGQDVVVEEETEWKYGGEMAETVGVVMTGMTGDETNCWTE